MSSNSNDPFIALNQVKFRYSGESKLPILNLNSWSVSEGERVLLIGSSGSGKSTLLKLLSGILSSDSGQIWVAGHALESLTDRQRDHFRATQIGYVAQNFNLIPYLSTIDNIRAERQWHKPVNQLSVGQQQRVAIARAIINKPKLLIADEPTSSLDQDNRDNFMSILMTTADTHNMTLIFVSHDLSLSRYFNRVDSMSDINKEA